MQSHARGGAALLEVNRQFYDPLWTDVRLVEPQRFNTWPLVCSLRRAFAAATRGRAGLATAAAARGHAFRGLQRVRRGETARVRSQRRRRAGRPRCHFRIVRSSSSVRSTSSSMSTTKTPSCSSYPAWPPPMRRCCSPCRCILGTGRHSTISSGTVVGMSRSGCSPSSQSMDLPWSKAPSTECDPNRRGWSMSACGFSRINVSGRCGGTTAFSCRWACVFRESSRSPRGCQPPSTSMRYCSCAASGQASSSVSEVRRVPARRG